MPELPEVETVTNALRPHLVGRCITNVEAHTAQLRTPVVIHQHPAICGATIIAVRRRAKYMLVELDRCLVILVHLGMTGSCRIVTASSSPAKHEHIVVYLDDGMTWRYRDPRRFGMFEVHLIDKEGVIPECLTGFGPEPLAAEFTAKYLRNVCRQRQKPIKNLVMDNACVVGVGNIYASESLYRARIHPGTPAARLSAARCERLVTAVRQVLQDAIDAGGTTISDFQTVDGSEGKFSRHLDVYDRAGEPCHACSRDIRRVVMAGRSTFYCPACQRY